LGYLLYRVEGYLKGKKMKYKKSEKYDKAFITENMMGPNCIKVLEEMCQNITLKKGMRVLDLGCGKGLTSIFLAKEFGVTVYATDLWISATENYERVKQMGLSDLIVPIHADALDLPYADDFFDAIISVDAYQYFGTTAKYMDESLAPLVKKGGTIALCVPGLKVNCDVSKIQEMKPFWDVEDVATFHAIAWWSNMLGECQRYRMDDIYALRCFDEAWADWLRSDNEHAISDRVMIKADDGKYMNLIAMIGKRIG
jgi:cyclopropane fatty-acyl-phospholipid synthase-like methyltransferase